MAKKSIVVDTKSLPDSLKRALRVIGYRRPNITVREMESVSAPSGGDGRRGVVIGVNLATGQHSNPSYGSWGGPNPFETKPVDTRQPIQVPANGAVITGTEQAGKKVWAVINVHPSNMAGILPQQEDADLSQQELEVLFVLNNYNSRGRKEFFERERLGPYSATHPIVQSLARKGLVKIQGRNVMRTTQGKNVTHNKPMPKMAIQKMAVREALVRLRQVSATEGRPVSPQDLEEWVGKLSRAYPDKDYSFSKGPKYARVIIQQGINRSAHSFIDMSNGDILLSGGWKRPAPGVRGNIFDPKGAAQVDKYGAGYFR